MRTTPIAERFAGAPLYAILDTAARPDLSCLEILESLLSAGVQIIQFRHKEKFDRERWEECRALARLTHEQHGLFLVNDRSDVAELCGASGVHLGQDDLVPEQARAFLKAGSVIGVSTHTLEQARAAAGSSADYLAIGPVFPTATKENPGPVVGLETVSKVRALTRKPLVAIGGITLENAPSVLAAGADAVAVIRDLLAAPLAAPKIGERAREFLNTLREGR